MYNTFAKQKVFYCCSIPEEISRNRWVVQPNARTTEESNTTNWKRKNNTKVENEVEEKEGEEKKSKKAHTDKDLRKVRLRQRPEARFRAHCTGQG